VELDDNTCYRALAARDRRFEGRFVVAVRTTGVYCRPGCPAPLPRPTNASFFACSAAAEEAGFRPCRRCRPETAPGTPAWSGTSSTVARALRLISEGELDDVGIEGLAARLGIGGRHLRRLFAEHLGASPLAIARTRRAHFARKLIDETRLPITEVALGAGFSSIRTFNTVMRATFRQTPRELRSTQTSRPAAGLCLHLPYRPPLAWTSLLGFLRERATPGVELVGASSYRRTVSIGGRAGTLEVQRSPTANALELRLELGAHEELLAVVERVNRLFDLTADPDRITSHLRRDPELARRLRRLPGVRVPGAWDRFELAVRAILGQQVSVRGATTLAGRLARAFGEPVAGLEKEGLSHLFPTPEALAGADLGRVGLTRARAEAIRALAIATRDGALALGTPRGLDEAVTQLRTLPGVGTWTAQYIAMRALGEPDAFPSGDLGLRRALARKGVLPSSRAVDERAEAWRPWRAYAAMTLWLTGGNP